MTISQLTFHIPASALPKRLQGKMEISHPEWIRKCLQIAWGKTTDMDNEILAYLQSYENHVLPDTSVSSAGSTPVATPTGEESSLFSSDMESSTGSRHTIHEKHNHECQEKERRSERDMDISDDVSSSSVPNSPTSPPLRTGTPSKAFLTNTPQKRSSSDTSPSQPNAPGDFAPPPPLPRKKRPSTMLPSSENESIHRAESGGLSVKEIIDYCRIKGRKGLYKEYARIKMEKPEGKFEHSK